MRTFMGLFLAFLFVNPATFLAGNMENVKAAFIRDGNLWTIVDNEEKQITHSGTVFNKPAWSPDGSWLLYQVQAEAEFEPGAQQSEVWAYHIKTGMKKKIFHDGYSPAWAPGKNIIAFNAKGILNISDLSGFHNIATGVDSYSWLPDGSGFLLSASGVLRPDGWTSAILFKKKVNKNLENLILFGGVDHFFTLPREVGTGGKKVISVYASHLHYSPSGKWISFIVSPTASWSMDSNMLCIIKEDGTGFEVLDEVVFEAGEPKWAPGTDTLAFIAGGGRIVFGFKNKDLKIREMPVSGSLTPPNYADLDFGWITRKILVSSRIKEKEWSNDITKHPLPSLYSIDLETGRQKQITIPPEGQGDFSPQYVKSAGKLAWLRGGSFLSGSSRTLWTANPDGTAAKEWLKNVEAVEFFDKETEH